MAMRKLISREPWWASPPLPGQGDLDVSWGYLEVYQSPDGVEFVFVDEQPTPEEVKNRKACRLAQR